MEQFTGLKTRLSQINTALIAQLEKISGIPAISQPAFAEWEKTCAYIHKQLTDETIRIAVVGPIKSGKSTFVNSLLKGDFLKRGAGVVTSFVTRVRHGKEIKASLRFKTWEEINTEIDQALSLLPDWNSSNGDPPFDIRNKSDRANLASALSALTTDQLISKGTRNLNSVLLSSYLKGYNRIKPIDFNEDMTVVYSGDRFGEHREFAGNEILAVYLKDIELRLETDARYADAEIADCQGSDSPNPLHMAMIQDYLLGAHMLIYVISSRTGLRQADMRFLSIIKKMGIMDNILFVINCDFSEHASLTNLERLVDKVSEEISLIRPSPRIFATSALFSLFQATSDNLPEKDHQRFEQWRNETDFVAASDRERARFEAALDAMLNQEWHALLLGNNIARLSVVAAGLSNWAAIHQDVLSGDTDTARNIISRMQRYQKKMDQIKSTIRKALEGAVQQAQKDLRHQVDRFFDPHGRLAGDIKAFIRTYAIDMDDCQDGLTATGFNQTLYQTFQDFKQALDTHMTHTITPRIIGFLRQQEQQLGESLASLAKPYVGMVEEALDEYQQRVGQLHIPPQEGSHRDIPAPEIEAIKKAAGLQVPPATAILRYSARVKTEAVVRLGLYTVINLVKKLMKKPIRTRDEDAVRALEDGVLRMKRETERAIGIQLKSYRENIKFQYLFKLVEIITEVLYERLLENFRAYSADLTELKRLVEEKRIDKERIYKILEDIKNESEAVYDQIGSIETELTSARN